MGEFEFTTWFSLIIALRLCEWNSMWGSRNGNRVKGADVDNVDLTRTPSLRNSRFTEFLIRKNALDEGGFKGWVFCPGMLFNSTDKWWGDQGKRDKPHEGLDLCLYKDREDTILRIGEKAKVPAIYDGIVVRIVDDFLGKSVIIEHSFSDCDNNRLCTIYGHTIPEDNLHVGNIVKEGDVIATLADSSRSKTNIFPHLHISLGWTSKVISYDRLDWENIGAPNTLTLLDPLQVIDRHYFILAREKYEKLGHAATTREVRSHLDGLLPK